VLGSFLDIEGASDNTSFNAISTTARERGLEETCCKWVRSMLQSRLVHTSLMGSNLTAQVVRGCPQGGVLCPLLWNLVVDKILVETNDLGYADVIIIIIVQGKFTHTVRELMQRSLDIVVKWAIKEGLNLSPHKTTIVPFTFTLLGPEPALGIPRCSARGAIKNWIESQHRTT
jgi:retron-type reverse transcriptase